MSTPTPVHDTVPDAGDPRMATVGTVRIVGTHRDRLQRRFGTGTRSRSRATVNSPVKPASRASLVKAAGSV